MAYRVKLMPRAERDLLDIYDWTGASSSDTALTWYRGLKDAIRSLSNKSRPLPGDAGRQQPPGTCSTAASRMSTE
jgi:plasmid stabilization system protein ParE